MARERTRTVLCQRQQASSTQSFEDFRASVQDLVAPEELAENMEIFFREQVSSALSDVQTLIPWYRRFNLNIITKDDVREFCAASIFQGPVGKVTNLFAYLPGKECKSSTTSGSKPRRLIAGWSTKSA